MTGFAMAGDDIALVTQTVLLERQGRDRAWWDQMRACYWPDAAVRLSWYQGDGPGFVSASEAMAGRGDASVHRLSPPAVRIVGDRALAEVPAAIEVRTRIEGVLADLASYTRIVYRLERRGDRWGIAALDCVYERDTCLPAVPGETVTVPAAELAPYRPSYALLSWHLARRGYAPSAELLGDDRPEETAAFYAQVRDWLGG
ncbi:nuclear transport factor 2 family protein [Streptomyces sp. NPDC047046]|uniref:nuclear transport factor 2 family protein n=1 Tax=Streptomyces sp. NPDC047046 TaxID=3155378 RepID=UPI0033DC3B61